MSPIDGKRYEEYQTDEQQEVVASPALYKLIVENAVDMLIVYDASSRRIYVSPASQAMLGYGPAEMLHKHTADMIHPDDLAAADAMFNSICPERPWTQHVFRARRRDGVYIWIEGHYRHLVQNDGVLAIMRDITASKRAEEILAKTANQLEAENLTLLTLSQQDSLTGLANRRCFDERLEAEFARARRQSIPLGLVLLDVDRFKAYNDHYGHVAGDDCLRRVSAAFAGLVRRPGDLIARYGGEEFVALLAATDQGSAMMMAERMRASIEALQIEHVGSKFGIVMVCAGASALVPRDDRDTATKLLRAADKALYQAKSDGRNQARGNTQNLESIAEAAIAARRSAPIPSAPRSS